MPFKPGNIFRQQTKEETDQVIFFALCLIFVAGLAFSKALLSISLPLFLVFVLVRVPLRTRFKLLAKNYTALSLLAFYALLLPYYFFTEDKGTWLLQFKQYIILLLFPLIYAVGAPLKQKYLYGTIYAFILFTTIVAVGTDIRYLSDIEYYNKLISQSKNIETVTAVFHIHFGVMIALSLFFGLILYNSEIVLWRKAEKPALLVLLLLLFFSLHLLAYRTGLLAVYVTAVIKIFDFIFRRKRFALGFSLLAILFAVPVLAYFSLESVQNRVGNTRHDIAQYYEGNDINHYSIAKRMAAWETAITIFKNNWVLGTGPADVRLEMGKQYDQKGFGLNMENRVMIHNQYLHFMVSNGIVGMLLFMFILVYPFVKLRVKLNSLAGTFILVFAVAMLVDSFFEMQRGLYLFVFFYSLLIIQREQKKITEPENWLQTANSKEL